MPEHHNYCFRDSFQLEIYMSDDIAVLRKKAEQEMPLPSLSLAMPIFLARALTLITTVRSSGT